MVCLTIKNKFTVSPKNPKKLSQLSHAFIYFYLEPKVQICSAFFPHKRASHWDEFKLFYVFAQEIYYKGSQF